jgi:GR25 family glycosyltransferase involved in LPS biosynthesis
MRFYVINLKRRSDRKESILKQFKKYNITNYEIVEAIDGEKLTDNYINPLLNNDQILKIHQKQMSKGEVGCFLSHLKIFKKILKYGSRSIILEDDALLTDRIKFIKDLPIIDDKNTIYFFHFWSSNKDKNIHSNVFARYDYGGPALSYVPYDKNDFKIIGNEKFYKLLEPPHKFSHIYSGAAYSPSLDVLKKFIRYVHKNKITSLFDTMYSNVFLNINKYGCENEIIKLINSKSDLQDGKK